MRIVRGIPFAWGAWLILVVVAAGFVCAATAAETPAEAPETPEIRQPAAPGSPSYVMDRLCVSSSGGASSSAGYQTVVVLADGAVQGLAASCSSGMQAAIGLCSVARDLTAPIVLTLDKTSSDAEGVELFWSGAEPAYEAFRSVSSVGVVHPVNSFAMTSACSVEDPTAGEDPLVFYNVTRPTP